MSSRRIIPTLVALSFLAAPACDSGNEAKPEAAAEPEMSEQDKRIAERIKKRKEEDAAKEKKLADAENAKKEALEKITVLPEKLPKKLDKACDEVAAAQDAYTQKILAPEKLEAWNEGKGTMLGMTKRDCNKGGSIEVAACQINALNAAGPELKSAIPDILRTCVDKFGKKAEGEGEAPPADG